jgi:hypothetical protein
MMRRPDACRAIRAAHAGGVTADSMLTTALTLPLPVPMGG